MARGWRIESYLETVFRLAGVICAFAGVICAPDS